mgnify:FL=1
MSLDVQQLFTDNIVSIITTLFGGGSFYAYYTEKNKRKIEEKQLSSDALKSMQDAYDKFTEDSLKRYEDLSTEVQDLKKKLIEVTTQLSKEKQNYATLREEHDNLKISYNKLKKDFDDYKKKYK